MSFQTASKMNALPFILIDISIRVINDTSEIGIFETIIHLSRTADLT